MGQKITSMPSLIKHNLNLIIRKYQINPNYKVIGQYTLNMSKQGKRKTEKLFQIKGD